MKNLHLIQVVISGIVMMTIMTAYIHRNFATIEYVESMKNDLSEKLDTIDQRLYDLIILLKEKNR